MPKGTAFRKLEGRRSSAHHVWAERAQAYRYEIGTASSPDEALKLKVLIGHLRSSLINVRKPTLADIHKQFAIAHAERRCCQLANIPSAGK
jgi:hypothetical protein